MKNKLGVYEEAQLIKNFMAEELRNHSVPELVGCIGFETECGFEFSIKNLLRVLSLWGMNTGNCPTSLPKTRDAIAAIVAGNNLITVEVTDYYTEEDADGEIINLTDTSVFEIDLSHY